MDESGLWIVEVVLVVVRTCSKDPRGIIAISLGLNQIRVIPQEY